MSGPIPWRPNRAASAALRGFAAALLVFAPSSAWALSAGCNAINTYGGIFTVDASGNGTDKFTDRATQPLANGEVVTYSWSGNTKGAYLYILYTQNGSSNYAAQSVLDSSATSGSGSFTFSSTTNNASTGDYFQVGLQDTDYFTTATPKPSSRSSTVTITLSCAGPEPTVSSVSPTAGPTAGGTSVTITGTNFSTVSGAGGVKFGGTNATGYTVNSATQITATAPARAAGTIDVTVTSPSGTSATSASDQYTYVAVPTVTSVSPTAGPTAGGTTVTITGTGFSAASPTGAVKFGATNATYTINSNTQITATAPANSAGTYDITVTTVGGTSSTSAADQYTYIAAPTVTSVSPTAGPTAGGTTVTITGTGFASANPTGAVKFGATTATYTINSNTQITATAPANSAGTYDITVTTAGGTSATSASDQYTYVAAPTVTSISPTAGPTGGGTVVTINGTNLTGVTAVTFGGTSASGFSFISGTQITATAPAGAAGTVDIRVTTTGGTSATSASDQYTYIAAPTVTSVSPTGGPTAGGTTVTITGTGFASANPTGAVKFGATNATYTINSNTQITATSPANSAGTYDITVTTPGGTSATSASDQYTYVAAPTVTSVSPTSGPTSGGTTVTITGTGFAAANPTGAVKFGATTATYTINSNTQITATSPANSAGTYDITVATPGGTSATSASDQYTYIAAPVASSFTATAVAYNASGATFSVAGHATNSPTSYAVGSSTTAQGGSVAIDNAGLVTYTAPTGFRGNDSFTFTATNLGGTSAPATVTVPVSNPTLASSLAGGAGTRGTALSGVQINTSGGKSPYSCATTLASGALPSGTQLNADCTITGTPAASGTFTFSANVTDSSTGTGPFTQTTGSLSLTVAAPTLSISPGAGALPGATAGASYSQSVSATGGTAPYTYTRSSGTLPPGLTLSGGTLSGTPTAVGTFNFNITAQDSSTAGSGGPYSVTNSYSITVAPPVITLSPASLPAGSIGTGYTGSVTASGGTATYSYAVTSGVLPAGVSLSASGAFSGTPTQAGSYPITITATDSTTGAGQPYSGSQAYTLTIGAPTISLAPATLTNAQIATAYSASISASGGTPAYTYAVTGGALPPGITLSSGGAFSGTPTGAGSYNFNVTVTDSSTGTGAPFSATAAYTITVGSPTIIVGPTSLPNATAGVSYSRTITASGGTSGYTFTRTAGTLPAGLTLASNGTLSGTPTQAGSFTFQVTATDSSTGTGAPFTGTRSYALTVGAATVVIDQSTLPNGRAGTAYSQTLTASGGTGPYNFAVTAGALPPGWTLASNGTLSGTATSSDNYSFTITATDSSTGTGAPFSASQSYTVNVGSPFFTLTAPTLSATVGQPYSGNFVAGGGTAPYSYFRLGSSGPLPTGLTLASDGTLSGTPTTAGNFNFTIIARDSTGGPASPFQVGSNYNFTVSAPVVTLAPASLSGGTIGTSYTASVSASGGTAPYSYAVTAGALPPGLTLAADGTISGTATGAGTFNFTITATDSSTGAGAPFSAARAYAITIAAPTITLTPATLPAGTPGAAYSQTLTATGGTATYSFTVDSGALPPGITLSTAGLLSGTPTATGAYGFTVKATDSSTGASAPFAGTRAYTLTIGTPTITVDTASLPNATIAAAYNQGVAASGGTGPYSYAITAGSAPPGITLSAGGAFTGTPTGGGTYNFTVTATDSSGGTGPFSGSRALSITVGAPTIALDPTPLANAAIGASYTRTITASGGTAGYTYAVTAGSLPAGITLATDGTLSGVATAAGTFNFTVTATDSSTGTGAPYTGSRGYTLVVGGATLALSPATLANGVIAAAYSGTVSASGGTAPYSFAVTAGALPAGVVLATDGNLSGTPTAGGSFNFTVTATDSSTGTGAPFSASRAYTLTIGAPAVTVSPASLPAGQMGTAYSEAITASGGTASYGFTVTAGALPAGLTLSTAGVLSGTPTVHGSFNFTVTATDSSTGAGPYQGTRAYTLTIAVPAAPVAANVGTTVAYNSSANPIVPSLTGGTATSVAVAGGPSHGTASVSGLSFSYTPAAGYYGPDSFTYTASNDGGTSSAATVSITVDLPPAPVAADKSGVGVPYASAGTAIDLSGSVTGVHSSIAIGTVPAHGTVTVAGDVVTYTPVATYYGADSFTYAATGPGGTSAAATVSLTVAVPPAPTVANKSGVNVGYNSPGTAIDLAASVSGVHSALTIGTAPSHGTVTISGDVITYTPTSGYYGADSFTYTATGPGGTSAAATVSLTVANPPPPVAAPGTGTVPGSTTTAGTSVNIDLSALVTGVYDSIIITTQPAHGTVTLSGGGAMTPTGKGDAAPATPIIATYTPAANYAGTDTFAFAAVGPGGTSAPATVTITVVGQVPIAVPKVATTGDGQMVSVMLTDGATRGPITGANVVSVSPANSATTAIVATGTGTYRLDVTPNNRYGGQIVVTYTLSNIFGASAPSTVTLTVEARPDPRNDPNVAAISDAQSEAARRFARAQVSNFMRRTEQLHHGGGQAGMAMGVTLNSADGMARMQRPTDKGWGLAITERMRMSGEDPAIGQVANNPQSPLSRGDQLGYGRTIGPNGTGVPGATGEPKTAVDTNEDGTRRTGSVATWAGGAIDIGTRDKTTDRSKISATTAGLSAGADIKLGDGVVVGLGGGYGNDVSHIGTAAQVRGTSTLYAAYASLEPMEGAFIDGVIGRGKLDFTTRRLAAAVNATARGSRDGTYTVAAVSLGIDRVDGPLTWSFYGRGEYMDADLDAYSESGAGRYNLRFDAREVRSITGTLGGRLEYRQKVGFGSITPRIRAEWNHEFANVDQQWLDYADIPGAAAYALGGNGWKREQLQLSLGTRFDILKGGWSFDFETGLRAGQGEKAGTLQIRLTKTF